MNAEKLSANQFPGFFHRFLPALAPVLLISAGYVDPGKWAATVEGGARFGSDLAAFLLLINFAAILCQYLSAHISVVTGKDLSQICSKEYGMWTCIFLGAQAELSVIALDLTMILGIAHGLHLILGLNLCTCIFLTAVEAVLFPLFSTFMDDCKVKLMFIFMAGVVLVCYLLGVLISQPEISLGMNGMLTKLSGETVCALMSLLGANIMPHNFYLHSSIVQKQQKQGLENVSKNILLHDHFCAILCIFSGIFLVNYVLLNSAANYFYSTGLVLLTFQDAISLLDQVFRNPIVPAAFFLVLFFSSQITAFAWNLSGPVILQDFFRLNLPSSLHRVAIRITAVLPSLYCVWNSGPEGLYQLLVFTQVLVALLLPSSVIPLFRVASSRSIMGSQKISLLLEFLALITFIGMLILKIVFLIEMVFGSSDWVANLHWNPEITSMPFFFLLFTGSASLCLMLWLAATPLKSASIRFDTHLWNWDIQKAIPDSSFTEREDIPFLSEKSRYHFEEPVQKPDEETLTLGNRSDKPVPDFDIDLPETIMDSFQDYPHLTTEDNNSCVKLSSSPVVCPREESVTRVDSVTEPLLTKEVSDGESLDTGSHKPGSMDPVEKTLGVEGDLQTDKDDEEGETWESEESSKGVSEGVPPSTSEGPGSFRSLSGKGDEGGNGPGSLSRLSGLGRAARRQLTVILDEFWGQLYDFHGQPTQEAKSRKWDSLMGLDPKTSMLSLKAGPSDYFPTGGGRGSDSLMNRNLYDSPGQQSMKTGLDSSYGVQRGTSSSSSSLWSNHMQLLDAYVQNSSQNSLDASEKRYYSLHLPPSSDGWDYQPATVHGYKIASYHDRIAKDRSLDGMNNQMESSPSKFQSLGPTNYSLSYSMSQKPQNGLNPPGFPNLAVPRSDTSLPAERRYYDLSSAELGDNSGIAGNVKKYSSMPDISGLSVRLRDSYLSERNSKWETPVGFGRFINRTGYEQSLYPNATTSRTGSPLSFDELSPSNVYTNAFSSQLNPNPDNKSFWSGQPFEQFGVASRPARIESRTSVSREANYPVDLEAKLLQSFRYCVVKLLRLEGSEWLFRQNDGADEDLIDRVGARERFLYEAESKEMSRLVQVAGESPYSPSSDRKTGVSALKDDDLGFTNLLVSSIPHCGDGCIWRFDLIVSFGVWCIHRVLELSLMESRPELWGKYTYVLNRLQGIIDLAFTKPRSPMSPCLCLQLPAVNQKRPNPPAISNGILPTAVKVGRGKCTTASTLLDIIKDIETAISCRKGRTGTAAGDVAFPKGKENLASVLKRYKRRLSSKAAGVHEGVSGPRKYQTSSSFGS